MYRQRLWGTDRKMGLLSREPIFIGFYLIFPINSRLNLGPQFFCYIHFYRNRLKRNYMRIFGRKWTSRATELYQYSVYFLKGNDSRLLNISQQQDVSSFVKTDELSTSFLLYNPTEATRKVQTWQKTLPWIKPHYAVKSNPCEDIVQDFLENGSGVDCASRNEIQLSLKLGASKDEIVYSNPIKNEMDLVWAQQNGIKLTTADSLDELLKIKKYAPTMGILWRISIKEEASDNLATPFSGKFGDDLDGDEMIHERMSEIAKMGIALKGIHFHCGSGQHGSSGFGKAVKFARNCIEIGRMYGHEMGTLDIGGGFPSGELSEMTIEALKPTENDPLGYRVIAEPGRHFSSNSFYLLSRIIGKRTKNGKPCYHINQSLYHSFNCNLMDGVSFENSNNQFYAKVDNNSESSAIFEQANSTILGMTCDGMDIIAKSISVPIDAQVGDWLCFGGMGSYTYGCRSKFNGMSSTQKVLKWPTCVHAPSESVGAELNPNFILV